MSLYLEIGWIPSNDIYVPEIEVVESEQVFYLDLGGELQWHFLWIDFSVKTYSYMWGYPRFYPARVDYRTGIGLRYEMLTVGWRHLCAHTVTPYMFVTDGIDGAYDEVFLRLEIGK